MTQKERALLVVAALKTHVEDLKSCERVLDQVLEEAQNGPPDGASDGSLSLQEWGRLKELRETLEELLWRLV